VDPITTGDWAHDGCVGWGEKECGGKKYWGGYNQCARGAVLSRVIDMSKYPGASKVGFKGVLWTVDSWDNEHAYMRLKNSAGQVMAEHTITAQWGHHGANRRFGNECSGQFLHESWGLGFYVFEVESDWNPTMGDVTAEVTTSLDEDASNESFGIGEMEVISDVPFSAEGDVAEAAPVCEVMSSSSDLSNWQHDGCQAWSERQCTKDGTTYSYYGGRNHCGRGATLKTVIPREELQGLDEVVVTFDLYTVESWDNEWAYIKLREENGNQIAEHNVNARYGHDVAAIKFTSECGAD